MQEGQDRDSFDMFKQMEKFTIAAMAATVERILRRGALPEGWESSEMTT